jgi:hypothetical protein
MQPQSTFGTWDDHQDPRLLLEPTPAFEEPSRSEIESGTRAYVETASWAQPQTTSERPAPAQTSYPFTTLRRRALRVTLSVRPLYTLATGKPFACHIDEDICAADGHHLAEIERQHLDTEDMARLDCDVYQRGMKLLTQSGAVVGVAPTSYRTLARTQGRLALLHACMQSPLSDRIKLFAELIDIRPETPLDRIAAVLDIISAERRGVLVRAPDDLKTTKAVSRLPVAGVCLDAGGTHGVSKDNWPDLEARIAAARDNVNTVVIQRLNPSWSVKALAAGATHAVFAPMPSRMI